MTNYNFTTLNDKEFEQITKDLLNAKFKLSLQDFKVGKDKGIDLRFSSPINNNSIVVQVKHYAGSSFSQLKHTLSKIELPKLKKLMPDRYMIATSLPLSAIQKDEIKSVLNPYILTSNDIFSQQDLNGYLIEFQEIEKNYFKLWFSSITVLQAVINNAIEGRTKYLLEKIKEKIPYYVITKKLDDANKILQKEKLLLITGQPGIGKTTLAEIILFDRAKNGFNIYKVENITEAENVLSLNDEQKQLFYFDDFLGANYFEIVNAQKTESQITSFVERVKSTPNKYLILTTRTIILNHAIEKYEKIGHSKFANQQFEIKLTDYDKYEKALILYNHLYFKNIKNDLLDSIITAKFYTTIIHHKNYTPRIIEFITEKNRIENMSANDYHQFIINNLNNPKEIWRYSFTNQIGYLERCLLITLFTFENGAFESTLSAAFEKRLQYEKNEHNQIINTNQFNDSVKILLNGFITSRLYTTTPIVRKYEFINPSLADFLIGYINDSLPEKKGIISSLLYVEQLNRFNPEEKIIPLEKGLQIILRDKFLRGEILVLNSYDKHFTENQRHATYLEILCKYCNLVNVDALLLEHIKQLKFSENWSRILVKVEYVLLNLGDAPQTYKYVQENFIDILEHMMVNMNEYRKAYQIPNLFEKYGIDYDAYCESTDGYDNLIEVIQSVLYKSEDEIRSQHEENVADIDTVSGLYEEIQDLEENLKSDLFPNTIVVHDFNVEMDWDFWNKIVQNNSKKADYESSIFEDYDKDYYKESINASRSESDAIDDLFTKSD